jgi:hypothetical protein
MVFEEGWQQVNTNHNKLVQSKLKVYRIVGFSYIHFDYLLILKEAVNIMRPFLSLCRQYNSL